MSIQPLITFKAGKCDVDTSVKPWKVKPLRDEGYIYLYVGAEDEMTHFCWRSRSAPADEPDLDLLMIPGDGTFAPYTGKDTSERDTEDLTSPVAGRIFVLKFTSSSQRHLFWLQSASQHPEKKANWFSQRDRKMGEIVDMLLQGIEVDVQEEMAEVEQQPPSGDQDGDQEMEDADASGTRNRSNSKGGAGADATGADVREEGQGSRDGGVDGGRAAAPSQPNDASNIVQNFLRSLGGGSNQAGSSSQQPDKIYTTLSDLLTPNTCISTISKSSESYIDSLLTLLPPQILLLYQTAEDLTSPEIDLTPDATEAAIAALSIGQKKEILNRVLRSPQLHQSLGSLTQAIRDGGLPLVSQSLGLAVVNGGNVKGGNVPLGGGEAVEAFVEGVHKTCEEEQKGSGGDKMDTS